MKRHLRSQPGFTLIELLVAISLTVLMLALIDTLFRDTTQAVTRGVATGKLIQEGLTISDQIARDAEHMLGPGTEEGVLIIVNKRYGTLDPAGPPYAPSTANHPRVPKPQVVNEWETDALGVTRVGGEIARPVRSDQLMFIRDNSVAASLYPISPSASNIFSPTDAGLTSSRARVWYGHVAKTDNTGTLSNLGNTDNEHTLSGGNIMGDPLASRWYFGRQAMLIAGGFTGIQANGGTDLQDLSYNAVVAGYPTSGNANPSTLRSRMGGTLRAYGGLADIAVADWTNALVQINTGSYPQSAVDLTYIRKRLRANPQPNYGSTGQFQYQAWQIAQMHPIMARGVSDFIVEFAGDYDNDDVTADIGGPDGNIDLDAGGNIRWYVTETLQNNTANPGTLPDDTRLPETYSFSPVRASAALNTRVVTTGTTSTEAYYVNDFTAAPYTNAPRVAHADGVFIFRHDDDEAWDGAAPNPTTVSLWPYLIRIRYRLHDKDGVVMQGDGQHGKWFESIIAVSRP